MQFRPNACPKCGKPIKGTYEIIRGLALVQQNQDGSYDYSGETDLDWNSQKTLLDNHSRAKVVCVNGHIWPAEIIADI